MTLEQAIDELQYCLDSGLQLDSVPVRVLLSSVKAKANPGDHYKAYYTMEEEE